MEITDFLAVTIVGGLLSLVISMIKMKWGTEGNMTKFLTIILSVAVAGGYVFLRDTSYYETVILVLSSASLVYAFLLKDINI